MITGGPVQAPSSNKSQLEEGTAFTPRFDADGLIPAIVTDAAGGGVLMFAYVNADAFRLTIEAGEAHFWNRSRKSLWRKGETSGNRLVGPGTFDRLRPGRHLGKSPVERRGCNATRGGRAVFTGASPEKETARFLKLL